MEEKNKSKHADFMGERASGCLKLSTNFSTYENFMKKSVENFKAIMEHEVNVDHQCQDRTSIDGKMSHQELAMLIEEKKKETAVIDSDIVTLSDAIRNNQDLTSEVAHLVCQNSSHSKTEKLPIIRAELELVRSFSGIEFDRVEEDIVKGFIIREKDEAVEPFQFNKNQKFEATNQIWNLLDCDETPNLS